MQETVTSKANFEGKVVHLVNGAFTTNVGHVDRCILDRNALEGAILL